MANPSSGDDAGSTRSSPTGPSPVASKPSKPSNTTNPPLPALPNPVQSHYYRFKLSDFSRPDTPPSAPPPPSQCARFRVTDFVPWATTDPPAFQQPPQPPLPPLATNMNGRPISEGSPSSATTPRPGGFSVMHMDVDSCGPQQTSSSVAAAGSTRGVLQKITVPSLTVQPQSVPSHQQQQGLNQGARNVSYFPSRCVCFLIRGSGFVCFLPGVMRGRFC